MSDFDDRGGQWGSEAEVDRLLRQEFGRTFAGSERPDEALESLRPSIRRARTVHRIQRVALGAAAAVAVVAGIAGVARSIPNDEAGLTIAGEVDGDATGDRSQHSEDGQELAVNGTTTTVPSEDDSVDRGGQKSDGVGGAATDGEIGNGTESTSDARTSSSTPSITTPTTRSSSNATTVGTSPPATDPDSSTSIQPDGSIAVITSCGRIIVGLNSGDLELVDVQPDPGLGADVKESSPRFIEIGLEGQGRHCEVKIRPSGNGLDVEVKSEGELQDG